MIDLIGILSNGFEKDEDRGGYLIGKNKTDKIRKVLDFI